MTGRRLLISSTSLLSITGGPLPNEEEVLRRRKVGKLRDEEVIGTINGGNRGSPHRRSRGTLNHKGRAPRARGKVGKIIPQSNRRLMTIERVSLPVLGNSDRRVIGGGGMVIHGTHHTQCLGIGTVTLA